MEFILTDEKGIEIAPLMERDYIDIDCGKDNTFEIQITNEYYKKLGISDGWRLGVQGKEYGGVIKRIITNTETDLVTLMGPTWRGMLEKKIIEPPHGQDYRVVSGDANAIINNIVCSEFDGIFICDGESGVSLNNFQFDRYVTQLAGIEKMLLSKNARLDIAYDSGEPNEASFVKLAAAPIKDYSDEIEYSQDGTLGFLSFTFEDFRGGINHLICLGKGELKDRLVLHLYADENGNIGTEQHFFGVEEREATYDYSSAGTEEDLRKNGTEKFKELLSYKSMDMDLFNETLAGLRGINDDISIGDIVGGRDFDTGIYLSKQITRKIVQVKNGRESIEYGVGKPVLNRNSANAPVEQSDPFDKLIKVTADGTGLAVGKDAELTNCLDVGLNARFRKDVEVDGDIIASNMKLQTYTKLDQLGTSIENITSWAGLLPSNSLITFSINNADRNTLYANGLIPEAVGGTITVQNHNKRGHGFFITDAGHLYVGGSNNIDSTNLTWRYYGEDYVVAQGTSGIWSYRKWNSGMAECWGKYAYKPSWSALGNDVYGYTPEIALPFTFTNMEEMTVNVMAGSYLAFASGNTGVGKRSKVKALVFQKSNSATNEIQLGFVCKGKWK